MRSQQSASTPCSLPASCAGRRRRRTPASACRPCRSSTARRSTYTQLLVASQCVRISLFVCASCRASFQRAGDGFSPMTTIRVCGQRRVDHVGEFVGSPTPIVVGRHAARSRSFSPGYSTTMRGACGSNDAARIPGAVGHLRSAEPAIHRFADRETTRARLLHRTMLDAPMKTMPPFAGGFALSSASNF